MSSIRCHMFPLQLARKPGLFARLFVMLGVTGLGLMLAGCLSTLALDRQHFASPAQISASRSLNKGDFLSIERREQGRLLDENGGAYEDSQLQASIEAILDRLSPSGERPELPHRIIILNSPLINAFSLPSGQLFLTRGLLALANDSSELASVLSHELAHVGARHAVSRAHKIQEAAQAPLVTPAAEPGALAFGSSNITLAHFSKNQELEADTIGIAMSSRAGYDPSGAVRFLNSMTRHAELQSSGGASGYASVSQSHPPTAERAQLAQRNAQQYATPGVGDRDEAIYLASIDGLIYGEDTTQGVVRDRQVLLPSLGSTFTAPEGFTLYRAPQAILGQNQDGSAALRFDVVELPAEPSLADYLSSGFLENVERQSIEALTVNGFPAATAVAESDAWSFRVYAIRLNHSLARFIFATKHPTQAHDRAWRAAANSFRNLSRDEEAAAQPLRLRVVIVRPGDTLEKLATRMAGVDRPLEHLLVLNGLQPGQALQPGDRLKIITRTDYVGAR